MGGGVWNEHQIEIKFSEMPPSSWFTLDNYVHVYILFHALQIGYSIYSMHTWYISASASLVIHWYLQSIQAPWTTFSNAI